MENQGLTTFCVVTALILKGKHNTDEQWKEVAEVVTALILKGKHNIF